MTPVAIARLTVVSTLLFAVGPLLANTGARSPASGPVSAPAPELFLPNAVITQGFDTVTAGCVTGWTCLNQSLPVGLTGWFQGNDGVFPAQAGAPTAYIGANFNNTAGAGTIDNWMITPQVNFGTGATLSFWSRTTTAATFADRLEIRLSTAGAATTPASFTIVLGTVNPSLVPGSGPCVATASGTGGYPNTWCQYILTAAQGIPTSGSGRIAFRYFVTGGGPDGTNSDYIGIDTFSFDEGAGVLAPVFGFTPAPGATVTATGGTTAGSTGTFTITPSIATAGAGTGTPATTTLTCSAPTTPFSGFGQTITAIGAGAITGGPLTGACVLGAAATTQTLTCSENRGGTITPRTFTLACPAGTAPPTPAIAVNVLDGQGRWVMMLLLLGAGLVAFRILRKS